VFVEAVVFLAAIIGVLLAISAFIFHLITYKPDAESVNIDTERVLDAVADTAMEEIHKTSKLILDELDEKYKALLFVYQLMDDKKKEFEDGGENAGFDISVGAKQDNIIKFPSELDISVGDDLDYPTLPETPPERTPVDILMADPIPLEEEPAGIIAHPRYDEIRDLMEQGYTIAETARKLSMGQGEVKLIIGLSGRASGR